jgi:hypothetical protein
MVRITTAVLNNPIGAIYRPLSPYSKKESKYNRKRTKAAKEPVKSREEGRNRIARTGIRLQRAITGEWRKKYFM